MAKKVIAVGEVAHTVESHRSEIERIQAERFERENDQVLQMVNNR